MIVSQILKSKSDISIISVRPQTSVADAVKILSDKRIGTVIVSNDGISLDGILSERDIIREMGKRGTACLDEDVSGIMTAKLITCAPTDRANAVLEKMTAGRFRHMPVMDDGALIAVISIADVVKARLSELSMEKDALEGMIMGH